MTYPKIPSASEISSQFCASIGAAQRKETPYRHWLFKEIFPEPLCTGILTLPIAPPALGRTDGTRNSYNDQRSFITPTLREKFPTCAVLAEALQTPDVARLMAKTCAIAVDGSYLRIEYIQDLDGAWLEPHHDIPEKLFSMVIYLFIGPDAKDWGTDIYDSDKRWVGQSAGDFNSGVIFVPGENTWHGFEPRSIIGVRRLMEINYVAPNWRDRAQLCFPDQPIRTG
ncbi:2OG-Fe(II) oxygenase [Acidiphilium sp.]|uniref:2OG-Fe(II) oxygenase n=1 Tax=Acidiphilium sp. TaxID=527 RepID=UPI0025846968|nr:2OG-Fe(II) oxygenase [Acidiphilium sp.]